MASADRRAAVPGRRTTARSIRRYAAILAVLLTASIAYGALIVQQLPGVTPIDGPAYADGFTRAAAGTPARRGETLGEPALDVIACSGMYGLHVIPKEFGPPRMTCGPDGRAVRNAVHAKWATVPSTAHVHPPTYFFATAWSVSVLQAVLPGAQDDFSLARLMSAVWFAFGALLLVRAAALWGANPWAATAVCLAFLPTPTFTSLFTFVTPDSMGLLVAGGVVLGVTLWWRRLMPAWPLFAFGLLTSLVKQTYVLAAIAGVLVLAALWYFRRDRGPGETARAAGWLLAGATTGSIAWVGLRELLASGPALPAQPWAVNIVLTPSPDAVLGLLLTPGSLIPGEAAGPLLPMPASLGAVAAALGLLTAAAAFGALFYRKRTDPRFVLAVGGVTAFAVGGMLVSVLTLMVDGVLLPAAPRYAMGAWPFYVLPLLLVAQRRWVATTIVTLIVVGAASWLL